MLRPRRTQGEAPVAEAYSGGGGRMTWRAKRRVRATVRVHGCRARRSAALDTGGGTRDAMEPAAGEASPAPASSSSSANVASSPPNPAATFMSDEKSISEILECPVCYSLCLCRPLGPWLSR